MPLEALKAPGGHVYVAATWRNQQKILETAGRSRRAANSPGTTKRAADADSEANMLELLSRTVTGVAVKSQVAPDMLWVSVPGVTQIPKRRSSVSKEGL